MENPDRIQERLFGFWEGEVVDRCCASIRVPRSGSSDYVIPQDASRTSEREGLFDAAAFHRTAKKQLEETVLLGDALPATFLDFGTAGHAGYFGCPHTFSSDSIWFDAILDDSEADLNYDPSNDFVARQAGVFDEVVRLAGGEYIVTMPDNCGSIDALAHLRGNENLLVDMIEREDKVLEWLSSVLTAWEHGNEALQAVLRRQNISGTIHGWMNTWSPGFHMQLQCDFSVMISPAMYGKYVVLELQRSLESLDHSIYHLDGVEQVMHLEHLLELEELDAIQWVPVAGQPRTSESLEHLVRIQKAGKALVLFPQADEVPLLLKELSASGMMLNIDDVSSVDEGERLLELIRRESRK